MANPTSPVDGGGYRLGMIIKKVGSTLTAVLVRAIATAATSGATDVGWMGVGTHIEDDPAVVSDASATPLVLLGGKRGSHVTVSTAGDVGAVQVDTNGGLMVAPGNGEGTLLASAARTATTSSADQTNPGARGVVVYIKATALSATPSVVPTIEAKDPITGDYFMLLTGAAITTAAPTSVMLRLYPGLTPVANVDVNAPLPRTWRLTMTVADSDSLTYSAAYALIP